jgi:Acyl-CoA carboxylase epsilon subunit
VIRGDASTEEVAAILAVLAVRRDNATAAAAAEEARLIPASPRSGWSDRTRLVRAPMFPGPAAWRRSALPS